MLFLKGHFNQIATFLQVSVQTEFYGVSVTELISCFVFTLTLKPQISFLFLQLEGGKKTFILFQGENPGME